MSKGKSDGKQKAPKTYTFSWEAKDKRGRTLKGEVVAASDSEVKNDLVRQGLSGMKVKKKSSFSAGSKKITPKDIAIFTRQLATMMSAGIPLVQAFDIIGKGHEKPAMRSLVLDVKSDVESGKSLVSGLSKHPEHFDDLVCSLVEAGEQAGVLETLLDKIATYKEKTEILKAKIKKALFYPTAVILVAFIVTAILLIFVVPQFEDLFKDFGADLPAFTKFVVGLSRAFQESWWLIFGGIGLVGYSFFSLKKKSKAFGELLDRVSLQLPIIGPILRKASIARYARTLATMFSAGVPLVEALDSVAGSTGNIVYENAVMKMKDDISTGLQLQLSMSQTKLFPNMVIQMVSIGEESGSLDDMLGKVADFYEREVDDAVDGLSSLLEPIIMAVLGVLIGGLIIAMYLPIFKLGSVV